MMFRTRAQKGLNKSCLSIYKRFIAISPTVPINLTTKHTNLEDTKTDLERYNIGIIRQNFKAELERRIDNNHIEKVKRCEDIRELYNNMLGHDTCMKFKLSPEHRDNLIREYLTAKPTIDICDHTFLLDGQVLLSQTRQDCIDSSIKMILQEQGILKYIEYAKNNDISADRVIAALNAKLKTENEQMAEFFKTNNLGEGDGEWFFYFIITLNIFFIFAFVFCR